MMASQWALRVFTPWGFTINGAALITVCPAVLTGAQTAILTLSPDPAYNLGQPKSATVTISENPL